MNSLLYLLYIQELGHPPTWKSCRSIQQRQTNTTINNSNGFNLMISDTQEDFRTQRHILYYFIGSGGHDLQLVFLEYFFILIKKIKITNNFYVQYLLIFIKTKMGSNQIF